MYGEKCTVYTDILNVTNFRAAQFQVKSNLRKKLRKFCQNLFSDKVLKFS